MYLTWTLSIIKRATLNAEASFRKKYIKRAHKLVSSTQIVIQKSQTIYRVFQK